MRCKVYPVAAIVAAVAAVGSSAKADSWSFGVMSDTQWTITDDGKNPNQMAANIIKNVDQQFVNANVKLVVAVGDMVDNGTQANDYARALYAQDLYNNNIGFFPMRGNHEAANGDPANANSGADFLHAYPQISGGQQNATPSDITTAVINNSKGALTNNPPATKTGSAFSLGSNFSSPLTNATTGGVSYSFQYNNATFMCLDQFNGTDYYGSTIASQQPWIDGQLSSRPTSSQAFVFTHKNLLGGNHKDSMFGGQINSSDPGDGNGVNVSALSAADQATLAAKQSAENNFLASMKTNDVKYVVSGHDHHEYNSIVTSPDGTSQVHQLICASDSSKNYTPGNPVSANDLPTMQQLNRVGYNIFTVDGPRVTIDYYSDTTNNNWSGPFNFVHQSRTGYSLNGKEVVVGSGASYALTDGIAAGTSYGESGYVGTSAAILNGTNGSSATTNYGKALSKAVNTGWAPITIAHTPATVDAKSDVLQLWGMKDLGAATTDPYLVTISYDPATVADPTGLALWTRADGNSNWAMAGGTNLGNVDPSSIVASAATLGEYGYDSANNRAWAVVNQDGQFVVAVPEPTSFGILAVGSLIALRRKRSK